MAPTARSYSITLRNLKPNTEYIIRVVAVNSLKARAPIRLCVSLTLCYVC